MREVYRQTEQKARGNPPEGRALPGGFAQVPNSVLRNPELSVDARLVYAILKSYAWQGPTCFPGQKRLRADAGMGEHKLRRALLALEHANLIDRQVRGQGRPTLYTLKPGETDGQPSTNGSNTHRGAVLKTHSVAALNAHPNAHPSAAKEYTVEKYEGEEDRTPPHLNGQKNDHNSTTTTPPAALEALRNSTDKLVCRFSSLGERRHDFTSEYQPTDGYVWMCLGRTEDERERIWRRMHRIASRAMGR